MAVNAGVGLVSHAPVGPLGALSGAEVGLKHDECAMAGDWCVPYARTGIRGAGDARLCAIVRERMGRKRNAQNGESETFFGPGAAPGAFRFALVRARSALRAPPL